MRQYEATLANPDSVQRVREAQREIERVGGKVRLIPSGTRGMTLVIVFLPDPYTPEQFVADVPFFRSN